MRLRSVLTLATTACMLTTAHAQAPRTIPFQGRLTKSSGVPVADGSYTVILAIYNVPSGGSALWSESKSVLTANGLFSTTLGSATAFPGGLTFDTPYYVGVTVPPNAEMTPRLPLSAVPYAIGLALPTQATTSQPGTALIIGNSGAGAGILGYHSAASGTEPGVRGVTYSVDPLAAGVVGVVASTAPGALSAGVRGINSGTAQSGVGVYGSHAGGGWGVYGSALSGFGVYGTSTQGIGVRGSSSSSTGVDAWSSSGTALSATSSTGNAGRFLVTDSSTTNDSLFVSNAGSGNGITISVTGTGGGTGITANSTNSHGVWGITGTMSGAGVIGDNNAGGEGVVGRTTSTSSSVGAVVGRNDGAGPGVRGFGTNTGPGVYGIGGTSGSTGVGGRFEIVNSSSSANALEAVTSGNGSAISATAVNGTGVSATSSGGYGIHGVTNAQSGAAILGDNNAGGEAVVGRTTSDIAAAVVGRNDGAGAGVRGFTTGAGPGVLGEVRYGATTGPAGRFYVALSTSSSNAIEATLCGLGNGLVVNQITSGASTTTIRNLAVFQAWGTNKARIDNTGKGYFNGGTQSSGADVAEAFAVSGSRSSYEPGDVLAISRDADRTVEKATEPYSTRVAGVYATKPGALLTERDADADLSDLVPLGVIGVIPTKVCGENGPIGRGDLLVTSSLPGLAMKAGPNPPAGSVLGKALAAFTGNGVGKINVLVNIR